MLCWLSDRWLKAGRPVLHTQPERNLIGDVGDTNDQLLTEDSAAAELERQPEEQSDRKCGAHVQLFPLVGQLSGSRHLNASLNFSPKVWKSSASLKQMLDNFQRADRQIRYSAACGQVMGLIAEYTRKDIWNIGGFSRGS